MESSEKFKYLRKIPGIERMDLTTKDFAPEDRSKMTMWAVIFFALAAVCAALSWTITIDGQPSLIFGLFFLLFAGLGALAALGRVVKSPTF